MRNFFNLLTITLLSFLTFSCSGDDDNNGDQNNSKFEGRWLGLYCGDDDSGTWDIMIDSNGDITGTSFSTRFRETFSIKGEVSDNGEFNATFGDVTSGAVFSGKLQDNKGNGVWINSSLNYNGTWVGEKFDLDIQSEPLQCIDNIDNIDNDDTDSSINEIEKNFKGNWSGTYSGDDDNGTWNIIIDSNGKVLGTAMSNVFNRSFDVTGDVNENGNFSATVGDVSSGSIFSGILKDGTGNGTWNNSSLNYNGTWQGSKN